MPRYITNGYPDFVFIIVSNRYKIIIISAVKPKTKNSGSFNQTAVWEKMGPYFGAGYLNGKKDDGTGDDPAIITPIKILKPSKYLTANEPSIRSIEEYIVMILAARNQLNRLVSEQMYGRFRILR